MKSVSIHEIYDTEISMNRKIMMHMRRTIFYKSQPLTTPPKRNAEQPAKSSLFCIP